MGIIEQKFGELLKLERERRQISLEDISADIKIPVSNLEGIENGDLSLLPSLVYYNLFARTYSQALGIDHNRTLEAIKEELAPEQKRLEKARPEPKAIETPEVKLPGSRFMNFNSKIRKLIGAAGLVVIVFLAYLTVDMLFIRNGANRNGASEMLKGVDAERLNALAGFNWDATAYKSPANIRIDLKPKSESWGTVMADGDTVIFRRLIPGRIYSTTAKYRLVVSIGVPQAVDIEINGRMVDLRDPISQRISRIEVNQANLDAFINPSLDNLPPIDTGSFQQGLLEPDTGKAVSISDIKTNPTDTTAATAN
jgi:transcriptional regulator with XRE-family HTH domain